jgi:hypothetical protein
MINRERERGRREHEHEGERGRERRERGERGREPSTYCRYGPAAAAGGMVSYNTAPAQPML